MVSSKQKCARALVASLLVLAGGAFAPTAGALSVTVAGSLTENSVGPNDFFADGMSHSFLVGPLALALEGASSAAVTYTFLFQESGFSNRFIAAGGVLEDPGDLYGSLTRTYASSGAPDFSFVSPLGTATNAGNSLTEPNFGVLLDYDLSSLPAGPVRTALASQGLLKGYDAILFLNDKGAGQDRDFDDLVLGVNLAAVPEPGTSAMIVAGLIALFWVGRRRLR
jgi:hypothetical protein